MFGWFKRKRKTAADLTGSPIYERIRRIYSDIYKAYRLTSSITRLEGNKFIVATALGDRVVEINAGMLGSYEQVFTMSKTLPNIQIRYKCNEATIFRILVHPTDKEFTVLFSQSGTGKEEIDLALLEIENIIKTAIFRGLQTA